MTITAKASIPLKGRRWLARLSVVGLVDEVGGMSEPGVLDIANAVVGEEGVVIVWLLQQLVPLQQLESK